MSKPLRYYQEEANNAIYEELLVNNKCIVKMFCGTGKSLLMRRCKTIEGKNLVVFVFPSLSLIDQFYSEYLIKEYPHPVENMLNISSENEATTNPTKITQFLSKPFNKIICITYQSFKTLMDNLHGKKINVCIFDEAHHAVGETYQKLIFENDVCEKQIFFTATPKNANGIVMYDRENLDANMCGKLVYDYSYLRGMNDGFLNPFEIRIDMFSENTNKSVYESIARAILSSGNNRVLTYHSDVNTDRDTSVNNFVNNAEFNVVFKELQKKEFPQIKKYKKVTMIGLTASVKVTQRSKLLDDFLNTKDNQVMVISSCETIGEGIDTKIANMCVFVDPKSSYVKIIQNIGRIVRKQQQTSTILIPCWVDKTKYLESNGDKEKCDEVIREDMSESGNFNGILNVLSALKQEDEELYDICLHYPDTYSPQEIKNILEKQGYTIEEPVGEGMLLETMKHLLDTEIDYENYKDCETDEEMIMNIAEENDVCIEIYTNSLENPVERYNPKCKSGETIRLYKTVDEETEEDIYQPIVKKEQKTKRNSDIITEPKRENRMGIKVHTNPDIKVLWNITSEIDLIKDICSCVIDCEVVKYDPMEVAVGIVERANKRLKNNLNLLPRKIHDKKNRNTPELEQEYKDALKLGHWKIALKGKGDSRCCDQVRDYLDKHLPGWRTEKDFDEQALQDAKDIVERANKRLKNELNLLPKKIQDEEKRDTPELKQEHKDAQKLGHWKKALKGKGDSRCCDQVRDYLDEHLPGWRTEKDFDEQALQDAKDIVSRKDKRPNLLPRKIHDIVNRNTPELNQEHKDAQKLSDWKKALKGKGSRRCSDEVRDYLDKHLPGWRPITINSVTQSVASVETQSITEVNKEEVFKTTPKPKKSMNLKKSSKKTETLEQKRERVKTEISQLHQKYKTMKSENLYKEFNENKELWNNYHEISEENEKSFPNEEIPRNKIIQELLKIKTKRTKLVVDMGCGKGQIADYFKGDTRFQFINYDHISSNNTIISCDISNIPLEEDEVEICILSLAMWGSNCKDYVKEANRILESGGKLYIIEPTKRWSEQDENKNIIEGKEGCKMKSLLEENGFKIVEQSIQKFCMFVCIKV